MKRFWHAWLAVVAVSTVAGTANAQWNQSTEIGSYQSILARSGYGDAGMNSGAQMSATPGALPGHLAIPNQGLAPGAVMNQAVQGGSGCAGNMGAYGASNGQMGASYGTIQNGAANGSMSGQVVSENTVQGAACGGSGLGTSVYGGGMVGGAVGNYGGMAGGCSGAGMGGSSVGNYVDYGASYSEAGCGDAVYQPGANVGLGSVGKAARNVNRVGSIYGLVLRRNYEDQLRVGGNAGQQILSDDVSQGDLSGLGFSLITRSANGNGWEVGYWGIDDDTDRTYAAPDFISIGGLADLNLGGFTVFDIYNNANDFRIYRDTEINNLEVNLLRNGGSYSTRRGRQGTFELLGGFRMFQFDESYRIVGNGGAPYPSYTEYQLQADNLLVGGQLGARSEVCLTNRLRLATGVNFGLFNNHVETRQRVFDGAGTFATVNGGPAAGRDFDYSDEQDDVSILGELRLGLICQISQKLRANIGYRAFGVSGIALAVDQVPLNFEDPGLLSQSQTNSSLLMHGLYFGAESCF